MKTTLLLLFFLPFLACAQTQEKVPVSSISLKRTTLSPVIDGKLDDQAWQQAARTLPFRLFNTPKEAQFETIGFLMYDDTFLYVGYRAVDPAISAWFHPSGRQFDGDVWMDDCVELYVGNPEAPDGFSHFIVNYDGIGLDQSSRDGGIRWNGIWSYAVSRDISGWSAEFSIPLYILGIHPDTSALRLNLCREKYVLPTEVTSWSCAYGDFHHTERFGLATDLSLSPWPVVITGLLQPQDICWGTHSLSCELRNDSGSDWAGTILLENFSGGEYQLLAEQPVTLKKGSKTRHGLSFQANPDQKYLLSLGIRDSAGRIWRQKYWNLDVPPALSILEHHFIAMHGEPPHAHLRLSAPGQLRELECRIEGPVCRSVIFTKLTQDFHLTLPAHDLPPGDYTASYILRNLSGTEITEQRPLKITSSPWE